jgi:molybdopterin molybdotransferase
VSSPLDSPEEEQDVISLEEATRRWLEAVPSLGAEVCALEEAAGRVAAEAVRAPEDLPGFDNAAMDGYAVRAADLGRERLRVVGEVAAGDPGQVRVGAGEAVRIYTGAPLPPGADTVVPQEDVEAEGDGIRLLQPPAAGAHVRPRGDDVRRGDVIVERGAVLGTGEVALLAASGTLRVRVVRRPRVAILTTGSEVREPEEPMEPGTIRNSNRILLEELLGRWGARIVWSRHVRDEPDAMGRLVREAVEGGADLLVTVGGVSVGRYDFVRRVLAEEGFQEIFWRVRMKPGKPVLAAARPGEGEGRILACGLPGNPVSAFVTAHLYILPALDRMEGRLEPRCPWVEAVFEGEAVRSKKRTTFLTSRAWSHNGRLFVRRLEPQGSHRLSSLLRCNALLRLEGDAELVPGQTARVLLVGPLGTEEAPGRAS